ncbi:MAG: methylated-DNA--[protein]-cysteine S-methyltransferase [Kofleriaceae bacterium]
MEIGLVLFETALGRCGLAWGPRGLVAVQLPEPDDRETFARLSRACPGASLATPPAEVQRAIDDIISLLDGRDVDLGTIALDMAEVPAFHRSVYEVAREIPRGATMTYGEIATRLGARGASRAVGQALGRNPFPIVVPCHRVVAAGQRPGGFSGGGGVSTKLRMLAIEGAPAAGAPRLPGF